MGESAFLVRHFIHDLNKCLTVEALLEQLHVLLKVKYKIFSKQGVIADEA